MKALAEAVWQSYVSKKYIHESRKMRKNIYIMDQGIQDR